jgi:predicted nucleic acid-binding protein
MVLVDTSIWIRFLSNRAPFADQLQRLLTRDEALAHDVVEGELLIGDRGGRPRLLSNYAMLTRVASVPHEEVVELVKARRLHGRGIGWIDASLLASALVARTPLWTADSDLASVASELGVGYAA